MSDKNKIKTETLFGIAVCTWEDWGSIGEQDTVIYNVRWCFKSMEKYNGKEVVMHHAPGTQGFITILDKDGDNPEWTKRSLLDIPEFREKLMVEIASKHK